MNKNYFCEKLWKGKHIYRRILYIIIYICGWLTFFMRWMDSFWCVRMLKEIITQYIWRRWLKFFDNSLITFNYIMTVKVRWSGLWDWLALMLKLRLTGSRILRRGPRSARVGIHGWQPIMHDQIISRINCRYG